MEKSAFNFGKKVKMRKNHHEKQENILKRFAFLLKWTILSFTVEKNGS